MMPAMPAPRTIPWSWLLALALLGAASPALASPSYSSVVEAAFELECAPSCLLCHTEPQGGFATANTKLGITLRREYDAECCEDELLASILEQLEAAAIDSDADGTSDADELRAFRDPSVPDTTDSPHALTCKPSGASGCATLFQQGLTPGTPRLLWSSFGLSLLLAWCVRRSRSPRTRP